MTKKILIVEDHALVSEAMAKSLGGLDAEIECLVARDAAAALALLDEAHDFKLFLIDLMLPDMSGFSLLAVLTKRCPGVPVLVVSAMDDEIAVSRAMKGGAVGFISKASSSATLISAVRTILDGGEHAPTNSVPDSQRRNGKSVSERVGLTAGQVRVLELLSSGKTNRQIAELLGLSEGTVKVHLTAIFRALGVESRAQALVALARRGMKL